MGRLKGKGTCMGLQLNGLSESRQTELNLEINSVEEAVRSGSYPAALSSPPDVFMQNRFEDTCQHPLSIIT